jgi:tight adherence protein C
MSLVFALVLALGCHFLLKSVSLFARPSLQARLFPASMPSLNARAILEGVVNRLQVSFKSKSRLREALFELPEILELISVSLTSGDGLYIALSRVIPRARGVLALELQGIFAMLKLGGDLSSELSRLTESIPERHVVEFANKLDLSVRRGNPLADMLREQASSARAEIRNDLLRQAGRNETRMLIPLVFLILPITVLFAIYPSLQLLNIDYL